MFPASRAHLSSTSLTKLRSFDTAAMPITARCQTSFSPTSATVTLKRERRRSTTLRTTCRLSFSEEAPWTWSVSLRIPTTICPSSNPRRLGQRGPDRLQLVRLDHVAGLEIGEVLDPDSALESLVHLFDVVLEALERGDLAGEDGLLVAEQPDHRGAGDLAVGVGRSRDGPELRHVEGLQHLRVPHHLLLDDGLEQALHGQFHVVQRLVDDVVLFQGHALRSRRLRRLRLGLDVEADDHRLRGRAQHHVAFGDVADRRVDDVDRNLRGGQFRQRHLQRLHRAMHIRLDDDLQDLGLVLLALGQDVVDGELVALRQVLLALLLQAVLGDDRGGLLILHHVEVVAGGGSAVEAEYFHGKARRNVVDPLAVLVHHRPDAAVVDAGDDGVPDAQRSVLDEDGRDGTTTLLELRLDDRAGGRLVRVRLQLHHFRLEQDGLEQLLDAFAGPRGHRDHHGVAAPLLGDQAMLRELLLDPVGLRFRLVDLVDRHHHRHFRGLGVVDGFDRLRHHAVVRGHHQHGDVGDVGAARPHGGERLVARRVEERDRGLSAIGADDVDRVRADVLRDPARLARRDIGLANGVEQRGLAVVDVTHDGDDRRPRHQVLGLVLRLPDELVQLEADLLHLPAAVERQHAGGVEVDGLVLRHHLSVRHQLANQIGALHAHGLGELGDGDGLVDADHLLVLRHLGDFGLLALLRALLLVPANRDVGALPGQLHQVLLGERFGLLDARALLAPLARPTLVVLRDVDELTAAARTAGNDGQLANLAHRSRTETASSARRARSRTRDRDQRPRQHDRARRGRPRLQVLGNLDRLHATRSLDDGSAGLRWRWPNVRARRRRWRRARRHFGDSDRNVADRRRRARRLDRAGRGRRRLLSGRGFRLGLQLCLRRCRRPFGAGGSNHGWLLGSDRRQDRRRRRRSRDRGGRVHLGRRRMRLQLALRNWDGRGLRFAHLHGPRRGFGRLLRGEGGGVLVFGGRVSLLAPEDHAAPGRLGCLDLGSLLAPELLDDRERLIVLERGRVALHIVLVRAQPIDHLLVGETEILRELVDALLRHPLLSPFQKSPAPFRGASSLVCCLRRRQANRGPSTREGGRASAPPPSL